MFSSQPYDANMSSFQAVLHGSSTTRGFQTLTAIGGGEPLQNCDALPLSLTPDDLGSAV